MPVINGVYLKDFPALPSSVADANIIPIAISGNQIAYRTTVAGIVTDARVTSKLLTGLSVTGSTILATDTILQAFGKVQNQLNGKVSSVGLTMPAAFNVANSPITSAGTLAVTAAGVASQYIRGDGALADFPTSTGGGSSVAYYLNGSVNQGTFVGNTYYEMNKTPVIGTGTDFTINANGYIAQFITDANDPASLLIPAGNWNVEMYFSASSNGGSPSFYVEVYKYDGSTFTLLGTSSATPEGITNGTAIDIYYTSVGIPETVLTITDRLAIRVYVTHSGRTITLHTEDNHLSEIVTTFSNGLTTLNGLTKQAQYFAVGSTGTDFAIVSSVDTHTFNIPSASATARGLITTGTQTIAGDKTFTGNINASPTSGNAIQAITTSSVAIQVTSTTGNGVESGSTTGAAIKGSASGALGCGVVGQASGTGGAGGYFLASGIGNAVLAEATGASTTALYGTANSASFPVQRLIQSGAGAIALFDNSGGTVATITNGGGLTLSALLTGATATFTNSGAGIGVGVTNSGSGDGIKITHSLGRAFRIESSSTGYGILINNLTASTSVPFTIQKQGSTVITMSDTGAANFTGQLTLGSTITNGTYTYTLPSATGTLALTSALSSYLPLSGGTLTGALNVQISGQTSPVIISNISTLTTYAMISFNGITTNLGSSGIKGGGGSNDLYVDAPTGATIFSRINNTTVTSLTSTGLTVTGAIATSGVIGGSLTTLPQFYINSPGINYGLIQPVNSTTWGLAYGAAVASLGTNVLTWNSLGNVGIGTASPTNFSGYTTLTVNGTSGGVINCQFNGTDGLRILSQSADTQIYEPRNVPIIISTNATERMRITSGGNVGIGTTTPTTALSFADTAGTAGEINKISLYYAAGSGLGLYGFGISSGQLDYVSGGAHVFYSRTGTVSTERFRIASTGAATFSSSVTATSFFESSSIKGKDIIKTNPLTNLNLDVIQYTRKTDESKDVRYGYSAEQIHSLMPELTDKDVTAVKYLDVHTLLIAQLQQELRELKAKLN